MSYSWGDRSHQQWVSSLVHVLSNAGIEIIIDKRHLELGDSLPKFMEQHIRECGYVLVVCTPDYRVKAEQRKGGVGYEAMLITSEIYSENTSRKYIPLLARGTWDDSAPQWLKDKRYLDLSNPKTYKDNLNKLISLLTGTSNSALPKQKTSNMPKDKSAQEASPLAPISIVEVVKDEVTLPKLDGSYRSALYKIPIRLSRVPSSKWVDYFLQSWDKPPMFTNMHRPGIATVKRDKIILDGTTAEEVKKYHTETLYLCVQEANEKEKLYDEKKKAQEKKNDENRKKIDKDIDEIRFD